MPTLPIYRALRTIALHEFADLVLSAKSSWHPRAIRSSYVLTSSTALFWTSTSRSVAATRIIGTGD